MADADVIQRLNAALEGRYRIERELGAGGMATVYLTEDLRHHRNVALKVLKPELAAVVGSERFLAEIETTANLQHPHILPLFDSGEADGFLFYVMPYVEGESLRERLDREHQLPVDDAVSIASDVASALDYAHSHGVIHRDIKPANILLSETGEPLVSDFGIALAVSAGGGDRLTETGLSLGTPHYMSPEQATGDLNVGPQADIWALGCVLYEMLVGEPPFTGSTPQAVLGRLITGEPPAVRDERRSVPPNVEATIAKALEKIPADRFAGATEFVRSLSDRRFRHGRGEESFGSERWRGLVAGALAIAALSLSASVWVVLARPAVAPSVARLQSPFFSDQAPEGPMQLSADGRALFYTRSTASGSELWLRRWESLEARRLPGTEGQPVFFAPSPDGREVAFVSQPGRDLPVPPPLRVLPVDGGPVRDLATSAFGVTEWSDDGMVYFLGGPGRGISRVPATGGVAEAVTRLIDGEYFHALWSVLPGGEVGIVEVYQRANRWADGAEIWAVDLETKERSLVVEGHSPRYANTGHLIFARADGTLMAAPFDESSMELAGPEVELIDGLFIEPVLGGVFYDVSDTGTLTYMTGTEVGGRYEFVWVDRAGQAIPVDEGETFEPGLQGTFGWQLSPDDEQIAFQRFFQGNLDIWTKELPDGPMSPLTFLPTEEFAPRWSPDGQVVTFRSRIPGGEVALDSAWLQSKRVDGREAASPVFDESHVVMGFWSPPYGEWLVVQAARWGGAIGALRPGVDSLPEELVAEDRRPLTPAVSPDGRWLAYSAVSASGRREVWVQPFPDSEGARWQVSTDGGIGPVWAHDGQELFYVNPRTRQLVAVEYETTPTFRSLRPAPLHTIPESVLVGGGGYFYDVSSDGERFLMARWVGLRGASTEVILVQDFFAELTRLAQH